MLDVRPAARGDDGLMITASGHIDPACEDELVRILLDATADQVSEVLVDFDAVEFCDSAGVRALLAAARQAQAAGVAIHLCGARGLVARIFDITGVSDLL